MLCLKTNVSEWNSNKSRKAACKSHTYHPSFPIHGAWATLCYRTGEDPGGGIQNTAVQINALSQWCTKGLGICKLISVISIKWTLFWRTGASYNLHVPMQFPSVILLDLHSPGRDFLSHSVLLHSAVLWCPLCYSPASPFILHITINIKIQADVSNPQCFCWFAQQSSRIIWMKYLILLN